MRKSKIRYHMIVVSLFLLSFCQKSSLAWQTTTTIRVRQNQRLLPFSSCRRNSGTPSGTRIHRCVGISSSSLRVASSTSSDNATPPPSTLWQRFRKSLPPAQERRKIVPLAVMFFGILWNYTIVRSTKDVLMITAPHSGAEVIPFLKTYVILPTAVAFTALYVKLTDWIEYENVFYAIVGPFLAFFALFAVAYPYHLQFHPTHVAQLTGPLRAMIQNWSFTLFYLVAELWGSVVASLLFWGFANEVTTVPEAKKYYPLFGLGANMALIVAGQFVKWVSANQSTLSSSVDPFAVSLRYLMGAVVVSGGVVIGAYRHLRVNVIRRPGYGQAVNGLAPATNKPALPKPTLGESWRFLKSRRYLRDLAVLVTSSGLCLNLVEVSWKAKLKQQFPDPSSYSAFMGNFSSVTGVATLIMMLIGRYIFSQWGWRTAALVAPTIIGTTGLAFFALNVFPWLGDPVATAFSTTPLMLAVFIGAMQNILSKSAKYSLFDPCKEMAYIPLDQESKTKGKAAIDVIGTPLGKSGSSLIQQALILSCGSLVTATPYLAVILTMVIISWFRSSNSLATQFEQAMAHGGCSTEA